MSNNRWIALSAIALVMFGGVWLMRSGAVAPDDAYSTPNDTSAAGNRSSTQTARNAEIAPETLSVENTPFAAESTGVAPFEGAPPTTSVLPRIGPYAPAPSPALTPSMPSAMPSIPSAIGYGGPGVGIGGRGVFNVPK